MRKISGHAGTKKKNEGKIVEKNEEKIVEKKWKDQDQEI